ncbi:MAG TPA: recombination protein RecR [Flavobacteriales bacterium]|nr:recombination protein RecR [Flavobacteriales bacterium]
MLNLSLKLAEIDIVNSYSSKLLNKAVEQFSILPGIGKRSALRLVLHLLKLEKEEVTEFALSLTDLKEHINYCRHCHNISDEETCEICSNPKRSDKILCVVEDIRDVIAIENTQQFFGKYHVLGGVISPIDGIGPQDLNIHTLVERIEKDSVEEIIMALGSTMEGDTTNFFIYKKIKDKAVNISTIARGMAVGEQLEYTDEITLGKSIKNRIPYEQSLGN